jgi:hypothetical protein
VNRDERIATLSDKLESIKDRTERIWAKNAFVDFPVYKAPTDLLILNPSNRRFRAEAQEVEHELGRRLDPLASPEDEESVIALLLDKDPHVEGDQVVGSHNKDTAALIADWDKRHQESPLWIRPDGLVSNGNRRLGMLKRLQARRGKEGYDWVDVVVLDEQTYDDDTLFEMEAREQLTEGLKLRYTKMNLLLTLKDAAEKLGIDWYDQNSIDEVSNKIQDLVSSGPQYAKVQLQAVKYMSEYLEWNGTPAEYSQLRGQVERFRDVGKNLAWVAKEDPSREAEMLEVCFQAISVGTSHPDMREIRRILKTDPSVFDEVVKEVETIEEEPTPESDDEPVIDEPTEVDEDEEEDEEEEAEEESRPAAVALSPKKQQIKRAIDVAVRTSRDSRESDPPTDIRLAASRLEKVDPAALIAETAGGELNRLREAIKIILEWADAARKALKDAPAEQP